MLERLKNEECVKALGGSKKVNKALKKFSPRPVGRLKYGAAAETSISGDSKYARNGQFFRSYDLVAPVPLHDINGEIVATVTRANHPISSNYKTGVTIFDSDLTFRAFVMLHEFGHVTGALKPDGFQFKDQEQRQADNNDKILTNCFKMNINTDVYGGLITVE